MEAWHLPSKKMARKTSRASRDLTAGLLRGSNPRTRRPRGEEEAWTGGRVWPGRLLAAVVWLRCWSCRAGCCTPGRDRRRSARSWTASGASAPTSPTADTGTSRSRGIPRVTLSRTQTDFFNYTRLERSVVVYTTPTTCIDDITITTGVEQDSEMEFHHVGLVGLELLTSDDPPTSASQSAGITGLVNY
ncbi:uncharacterized protein LOC113220282 isoform X2 [Piliocolobus tephrosceles]|uniref:uncharacterized protein LOC113220282 isoform X2 n=1 Tax=Piliocolobus tephrosceles TaxID=591936 RepID=UPI000E6AEB75|nr:uncharacterized protein LOC113220282 isoform X2 [Piliocolobus tephrosceles]